MRASPQEAKELFQFTKENINRKLHFLCSGNVSFKSELEKDSCNMYTTWLHYSGMKKAIRIIGICFTNQWRECSRSLLIALCVPSTHTGIKKIRAFHKIVLPPNKDIRLGTLFDLIS